MKESEMFEDMLKQITALPFVKDHISAIYAAPEFLTPKTVWIYFYYEPNMPVLSRKEYQAFEQEVSRMFCDAPISCSIEHISYADDATREGAAIWSA